MSLVTPTYQISPQNGVLRQSEIISGLVQIVAKVETLGSTRIEAETIPYDFAIVVSQDCDLQQDFDAKMTGQSVHRILKNILFCQAEFSNDLIYAYQNSNASDVEIARSKEWKDSSTAKAKIRQNNDFRFHYLRKVVASDDALGEGIDSLVVDFSRTFSIPRDEVYKRIELQSAKRRAFLNSPYLEHLAVRYHHFHCRVALPLDHHRDPPD